MQDPTLIAGLLFSLVALALLFMLLRRKKPKAWVQTDTCPECGWSGQTSRYAGRCPSCNTPIGEGRARQSRPRTNALPALGFPAAAVAAALIASAAAAEAPLRIKVADPVLDRDGDGYQDVIVADRSVHFDLDADGRFDYSLALAFKKFVTQGHHRYLESGLSADVFAQLTRQGLDALCASERVDANWTAEHFREFLYYHDGYGRLQIFDASPENDGRLAGKTPQPRYEYTVVFNPDGTVATVQRGDRTIALASFDYEKNVSLGTRLLLPRIAGPANLAQIRAELGQLFVASP